MKEVKPLANSEQAIKRVRQSATKAARNTGHISRMRSAIKNYKVALETGEGDKDVLLKEAIKQIDRSASKGLIHPNKATRHISKLARLDK